MDTLWNDKDTVIFFNNQNNNVDFMTCRALARRLTYMFSRLKKGHIMTFCQKNLIFEFAI